MKKKFSKEVFDYFKQEIDYNFFLDTLCYYNEDLIVKMNKLFVKIDNVELIVSELLKNASVKFINSLFKRELEFSVNDSVVEDELNKNGLDEALNNFRKKKIE